MSFAEKRQRCQSQLQSGCPLSTDMLIHLCGLSKQRMRGNAPFFVLVARAQECSGTPYCLIIVTFVTLQQDVAV